MQQKVTDLDYQILKFSSYLNFESSGAVQIKKIDSNNFKFNRCKKALLDNQNEKFFKEDEILRDHFSNLDLIDAYRIENGIILKDFEK